MSFPLNPINNQIYKDFKYDSSIGAWNKTNYIYSVLHDSTKGMSIEFLNGVKLQFGKTPYISTWPYTQEFYDEISPRPSIFSSGPRGAYFTSASGSNIYPTTLSMSMQFRSAGSNDSLTAATYAHWMAIGGSL